MGLTWNPADASGAAVVEIGKQQLRSRAPDWQIVFESRGLIVAQAGARREATRAYVLDAGAGVVLGTLFDRSDTEQSAGARRSLSVSECERIRTTRGRALIDRYWGRYVAFIIDAADQTTWVLRDPVGALPCYAALHEHVRIFFSSADDIARLRLLDVSIDWSFVAAHVHQPRLLRCSATGFNEIQELLPGECWQLRSDQPLVRQRYWNPAVIASTGGTGSIEEAIAAAHRTASMCISAWASCYSQTLLLLSGGIDSSIVLSRLLRGRTTALTFFDSTSAHSDERRYARIAAASAECPLIEIEEHPDAVDLSILLKAARSVRPWDTQYYQTHGALEKSVVAQVGAKAVFSGGGGDHLFFQSPMILALGDYLYDHGLGRAFTRLCKEIAYAEGLTFWSVLMSGLSTGLGWEPWQPDRHARRIRLQGSMIPQLARDSGLLRPAWLDDARRLPYGKVEHVRMSAVPHDFYDPFGLPDAPDRVMPLLSQPLVELCLRIPTYVLAHGGRDRFIERQAFHHALPAELTWRHAKGSADAYMQRLLRRNLPFVREMMLDGVLVSRGYLDRPRVERALSGIGSSLFPEAAEIVVFHLSTEAWLQSAKGWTH